MATQCSRCHERYPSPYYFVAGLSPSVCNKCVSALDHEERERLLAESARAVGEVVRRCLRCETAMMRGELAYRDRGPRDITRVRDVSWVLARREDVFLGLLTDWVVDKALEIDAWRCGKCGRIELATDPDPAAGDGRPVRARRVDDSTLL